MKEFVRELVGVILFGKEKYIGKTFAEMEEMQTIILRMLTRIRNEPIKCQTIIYKYRDNTHPKVSRLIKNFKAMYYFRRASRRGYADVSTEFLKIIDRIFELSCYPDSDLTKNSFLTLLDNRDYFTTYSITDERSFLEKIKLLSDYYYRKVDEAWEHVCEFKTLNDNDIF